MDNNSALFNNNNLTDAQILDAIDVLITDLTHVRNEIVTSRKPESFGTTPRDAQRLKKALSLVLSLKGTSTSRRKANREQFENDPETRLLRSLFSNESSD